MRTTYQRFNEREFQDPLAIERAAGEFGLDAQTLARHLGVMGQMAEGSLSGAGRKWLYQMADQQGIDRVHASALIEHVLAQPGAEQRARAYVNGIGAGGVDGAVVERAMALHKHWQRESAVVPLEDRLAATDKQRQMGAFEYEDTDQLKRARSESNSVRKAIEASLVSSGLQAPPPRSLQEAQKRAQARADGVADRMEQRNHSDVSESLRDTIATAYETESAIQQKVDVGLLPEGTSSTSLSSDYDCLSALGQSLVGADE